MNGPIDAPGCVPTTTNRRAHSDSQGKHEMCVSHSHRYHTAFMGGTLSSTLSGTLSGTRSWVVHFLTLEGQCGARRYTLHVSQVPWDLSSAGVGVLCCTLHTTNLAMPCTYVTYVSMYGLLHPPDLASASTAFEKLLSPPKAVPTRIPHRLRSNCLMSEPSWGRPASASAFLPAGGGAVASSAHRRDAGVFYGCWCVHAASDIAWSVVLETFRGASSPLLECDSRQQDDNQAVAAAPSA